MLNLAGMSHHWYRSAAAYQVHSQACPITRISDLIFGGQKSSPLRRFLLPCLNVLFVLFSDSHQRHVLSSYLILHKPKVLPVRHMYKYIYTDIQQNEEELLLST